MKIYHCFFVCAAYAQSVSDSQVSILLRSVEDSDRGGSTKPINNTSITHIDTGLHTNAIGLELAEFLSPTESAHQSRNSTNFGSAIPRLVKCNAVDSAATDDRWRPVQLIRRPSTATAINDNVNPFRSINLFNPFSTLSNLHASLRRHIAAAFSLRQPLSSSRNHERVQQLTGSLFLNHCSGPVSAVGQLSAKGPGHFLWIDFQCRSTSSRSRDTRVYNDVVWLYESYLWIETLNGIYNV